MIVLLRMGGWTWLEAQLMTPSLKKEIHLTENKVNPKMFLSYKQYRISFYECQEILIAERLHI